MRDAQSQYYSNMINNSPQNDKQLFSIINNIYKPEKHLYSEANVERCNYFTNCFMKKYIIFVLFYPIIQYLSRLLTYSLGFSNLSAASPIYQSKRLRISLAHLQPSISFQSARENSCRSASGSSKKYICLRKFNLVFVKATETASFRVTNYLLMTADACFPSLLILLDLNAAFDTMDHNILLYRLHSTIGLSDSVYIWFLS